ncbi:MAG: hypothetical protein CBC35_03395 [Planctomycetes bacterium TMED75]|nr:(2Fe-2S)-binding protein [Planctomycetaceae bacterium]OUU94759.1 MAG: hypothetical protein CBC35_03395 [Planctomycetes bacterium TMED75]
MSNHYQAVNWSGFKIRYDLILASGVILFLALFVMVSSWRLPADQSISGLILVIRALGACGFTLLTLILCIGPLARLSPRFLPLLYNRRHLGVAMFGIALAHAVLAAVWYHAFGDVNPVVSILTSSAEYSSFPEFPFQPLGLAALVILLVMAATSHDYWLSNLGPRTWKSIHLIGYLAYALLVGHIALGVLQYGPEPVVLIGTATSVVVVASLHLISGLKERRRDRPLNAVVLDGWIRVGDCDEIPPDAGKVVSVGGCHRVAVFRKDEGFSAISNTCAHQGGPLGEGRLIDGCLTCPWHGYQYIVTNGQSPPPFTERIETYELRIDGETIWLNPNAKTPGTEVPPATRASTTERD